MKSVDHDLCISVSHLSNESADIPDAINSNWEFDVSLILSHASNLNSFGLNPTVQIVKSGHWKRENINFWLPFLASATSRFWLLKVPNNTDNNQFMKYW